MRSERMAPKRSIASLVRKKISDITNSHPHPKLHTQPQKPLQTSPSHDISIQQLLKEKEALMQHLAERDKIIEMNGAELMRLRANVQKLQLQNWNLAQSNTQILAELNLGRERIKALQHDILCKAALLQGKNSEVRGKEDMNYENNGSVLSKEVVEKAEQPWLKASNDDKLCNRNRRRTKRSRSVGYSTASTKDANESKDKLEIRPQMRAQPTSFKTHEYKPMENSFEIENAESSVSQTGPKLHNSPATEDEAGENSGLKPLRKSVEKVQSYKEIPLKAKQRRLE